MKLEVYHKGLRSNAIYIYYTFAIKTGNKRNTAHERALFLGRIVRPGLDSVFSQVVEMALLLTRITCRNISISLKIEGALLILCFHILNASLTGAV